MKAAIHQPHYFPWLGYFDKMAKADVFVILDQVQLEKGSQMIRNRVIASNGNVKYLTISAETENYLQKEYLEIRTKDIETWTNNQKNAVKNYYRKADAYKEMMPIIDEFLSERYQTVCEWTCSSIGLIRELLKIETPLIKQSEILYDHSNRKSDLVYAICNALGADTYLSGRGGSLGYLDQGKFAKNNIRILFQEFQHPEYQQVSSAQFVPGISILDMLFNCGIDNTRKLFWSNVRKTYEFKE